MLIVQPWVINYIINVDLTTHQELYIQISVEWDNTSIWSNNFDNFKNSPQVQGYNQSLQALQQLVKNKEVIDVLKIESRSFRPVNSTFIDFTTNTSGHTDSQVPQLIQPGTI